jgi:ATP-binding cassette, subfamily B, multidrug efflux pump
MSPWMDLNDTDAHEKAVTIKDLVLFKSLLPFIKPHWKPLLGSFLLLPLISLSQVLQPVLIKRAIDGPITQGDIPGVLQLSLLFLGLLLLHYGLRYVQMFLAQVTGQRIILSLRSALYDHLQSLPVRFFHKTPIGVLVTRISSDVENISEVFASGGIAIFSDLAVIAGIIIAMFWMNVPLACVAVMVVPLIIITMEYFRRRSRSAYNDMRVQLARINASLQETLTGIDVIQLLRREKHNTESFKKLGRDFMNTNLKSVIYDSSFTASVEFLSFVTVLMVLGYIVVQQTVHNPNIITFGVLVAFLQYIQMLFEPIEEISDKFTIIQSGLASVEKIMELMQVEREITSPPQPVPLAKSTGHIRVENVTFGYRPGEPILKNISLEIRPGEKVALIGATGAGKSTLIKLLNRQYDVESGRILMDGTDIREYALGDLRRNIVVIPQEEFLFSRSIAENITLSYQKPVETELLATVAGQVHANVVLERFQEGYETVLPERGRNLSNGERQLLVFARALWHDPAIIVLDEATSSIDPKTEALLQDALEKSLVGRTAIIIAHRLSTIEQVDTIYVIEHGEIVESGSPEALYHQNGIYHDYLTQHFTKAYNSG